MRYRYKATTGDGRNISGIAEAGSKKAMIALLHRQGLHPILIEAQKDKIWNFKIRESKSVKLNELVIFTRQLATMVAAGVPLPRSLNALQKNIQNDYLKRVLAGVCKDVESGMSLGDSFSKYPKVFSNVYVNMVRAGEEGGILDEILKRLATQVEQDASMKRKIRSAMMYPTVILSVTVIAFFGIMIFIVPKLGKILTTIGGPNATLPIYTQFMLGVSDFFVKPSIMGLLPIPIIDKLPNFIVFAIILLLVFLYISRYIKTPKGKLKYHTLLLKTPIVKDIIQKVAIARFARTFSSLMSAGVSVLESLRVTGAAIGNVAIERELRAAALQVKNGRPLSEPLANSRYFPPIVSQMILVGEETGHIDSVLTKVAEFYEEEVEVQIDGLASVIEPVLIIILGAGVGLIAASVMGPIANLSKNIGN